MTSISLIVYRSVGICGLVIGLSSITRRPIASLGLVLVAVAGLNAYVESFAPLRAFRSKATDILLMAAFLTSYGILCISLVRRQGVEDFVQATFASGNPLLSAWFLALVALFPASGSLENPRLANFVMLALVAALQVPVFVAFRDRVLERTRTTRPEGTSVEKAPSNLWRLALLLCIVPLLVTFAIQILNGGDWRLLAVNFTMMAAIASLFWVSRCRYAVRSVTQP